MAQRPSTSRRAAATCVEPAQESFSARLPSALASTRPTALPLTITKTWAPAASPRSSPMRLSRGSTASWMAATAPRGVYEQTKVWHAACAACQDCVLSRYSREKKMHCSSESSSSSDDSGSESEDELETTAPLEARRPASARPGMHMTTATGLVYPRFQPQGAAPARPKTAAAAVRDRYPPNSVFVDNLPESAREDELAALFEAIDCPVREGSCWKVPSNRKSSHLVLPLTLCTARERAHSLG
eukprot:m.242991 g.242991  ORF g.242991 m.242991 type:complete len:243 (-) comp10941_c0_seq24:4461-5189(-)